MIILIIGSGPAGYTCAVEFANNGIDVVVVEKKNIGGICLNEGCIPTKSLLYNSRNKVANISWANLLEEKDKVITTLRSGVNDLLLHDKIRVILGKAKFVSLNSILVNGEIITFDKAIIATGSSPIIPNFAQNIKSCIESTEALSLNKLPKSICVIGGGVIGCELATLFNNLGVKTTILEAKEDILIGFEKKHIAFLKHQMNLSGIDIHTSSNVSVIRDTGFSTIVVYKQNGVEYKCACDKVLFAIGRKANIEDMGISECNVVIEDGIIKTDNNFKTTVDNIYAIGDCASHYKLAYWGSTQAKKIVKHIINGEECLMPDTIPSCVFTSPEIAKVGKTEAELEGYNIKCAELPFSSNGKAHCIDAAKGYVKIIIDAETRQLLGGHIIGPNATELISILTPLVMNKCSVDLLASSVFAHPTLSEIIVDVVDLLLN